MPGRRLLLSLFLACSCVHNSTRIHADEAGPRDLLAVKNALKRAESEILKNLKDYKRANADTLKALQKDLTEEENRLKKAKKVDGAAAVKQLAEDLQNYMVKQVEAKAGPDAWQFNKHTYKVFREQHGWHAAKQHCEQFGGHLAIIEDAAEQKAVATQLANMGLVEKRFWIGASDEKQEGKWEWVNGGAVQFSNWAGSEPNNSASREHFLEMKITQNGQPVWNDLQGGHTLWFICEWDN